MMFWNSCRRNNRCCPCCPCRCTCCSSGGTGSNANGSSGGVRYVDIPATRIVVSDADSSASGCSCAVPYGRCR
ncbi:MAG: hypothetical protein IJO51_02820 [Clostridia bacterium]|nr:hypothetical protein [Clostridia bacterium]